MTTRAPSSPSRYPHSGQGNASPHAAEGVSRGEVSYLCEYCDIVSPFALESLPELNVYGGLRACVSSLVVVGDNR